MSLGWRVLPDGEKQWRGADGNWYSSEELALEAGSRPQNLERPAPAAPASASPTPFPGIYRKPTKKELRAQRRTVTISPSASYVGGMATKGPVGGSLVVREGRLAISMLRKSLVAVRLGPGAELRVRGSLAPKSRAGKVLAFGVVGLAAKSTQMVSYVLCDTATGTATFQVNGMAPEVVAAKLTNAVTPLGVLVTLA